MKHPTLTRQVNWAQSFNVRGWPEKILVGPNVDSSTAPNNNNVLFSLYYPPKTSTPSEVPGYENNGNIQRIIRRWRETAGATERQRDFAYEYDRLNRLSEFTLSGSDTAGGVYTYNMDLYGNITGVAAATGDPKLPTGVTLSVDETSNQLESVGTSTMSYDVLGNQVTQTGPEGQALALVYLDQGHIRKVKNSAGTVLYRYYYDADGKRRIKAQADAAGVTSVANNCSYSFYEGEELICQFDRGTQMVADPVHPELPDMAYYGDTFLLLDHLGSTRAELEFAEVSGSIVPRIAQPYDYMPYGERIGDTEPTDERKLFTGKPRDNENRLDSFGARFFSNQLSRWISPDQPFNDNKDDNPQSWNLFSYVGNNPINFEDIDGFLKRDKSGRLWRTPTFTTMMGFANAEDAMTKTAAAIYTLKTDLGTEIPAYQNNFSKEFPEYNTNCHGLTFADGQFWINPPQARTILNDEYNEVDPSANQTPQAGDAAVFEDEKGNPIHSMTVSGVDDQGNVTEVVGLGGVQTEAHSANPQEELRRFSSRGAKVIKYYRKKSPDPHQLTPEQKRVFKKPEPSQPKKTKKSNP